MNVLVLNCGSSSLKFQVIVTDLKSIEQNTDKRLAKGLIERIGSEALITTQAGDHPPGTASITDTRSFGGCRLYLAMDRVTGI